MPSRGLDALHARSPGPDRAERRRAGPRMVEVSHREIQAVPRQDGLHRHDQDRRHSRYGAAQLEGGGHAGGWAEAWGELADIE